MLRLGAKYPAINWTLIDGIFNRTISFRKDADVTVKHGYFEAIEENHQTELPPSPELTSRQSGISLIKYQIKA